MATARDIIKTALRYISVVPNGAVPSAVESNDALETLNDMVAGWQSQNIYTGAGTLSLDDDFPLDDRHIGAVKYMLAVRLAPEFGMDAPAKIQSLANSGWQLLFADYNGIEDLRVDVGLARMPSQRLFR